MIAARDIILETRGLSKSFGGFLAVKNVSLKVERGSVHALIGPNGAGKSTLFHMLTRFLAQTEGRIFFKGGDISAARPHEVARRGIARSFQISATFPHMTLKENVRLALQSKLGWRSNFWKPVSAMAVLDERVAELLDAVGLADDAHQMAAALSYGRKRALEIATTLALDPELMLLDEPMAGVGREDIERISGLIKKASGNRTVLMVEHNIKVVAQLCDRITVLRRGEILAEGDYPTVSKNREVIDAYLGAAHEH